jgi:hypothetical protein
MRQARSPGAGQSQQFQHLMAQFHQHQVAAMARVRAIDRQIRLDAGRTAQSALIARNARLWQNSREKRHD